VRSPRTQQADRLQSPTAGPVLLRQPVTGAAIRDCVRPLAECVGLGARAGVAWRVASTECGGGSSPYRIVAVSGCLGLGGPLHAIDPSRQRSNEWLA
jgi:hypothetical protein